MDYSANGESHVEKMVGISLFANAAPGFQGIMKQRYSDFIVREVGLGGEVTGLKSLSTSALENAHFNQNVAQLSETENDSNDHLISSVMSEVSAITGGIFGGPPSAEAQRVETIEEELKHFLLGCLEKSADCPASFTACPCPDKISRTKIHQVVRKYLSTSIESEALDVSGAKYILLRSKHKMEKGTSGDWRSRNKWPSDLGNYLQFTLFKENIDSMSAAHVISKALVCKVDSVQFAGTKDKRAVTTQKVTMYRRKPSDIAKMNRFNLPPYIRVGDFEYVNEPLKLGALAGNNFGIIMRDCDASSEDIKSACKAIGDSGFVNFFGLQRFGSGGTKSHHSGLALFRQDWKQFVEMLFAPREGDRPEVLSMKEAFYQKDYKKAHGLTPMKMPAERSVLESLAKKPDNFEAAFSRVPKNQWLMCLHAYQSYIWNMTASERIRKHGAKCIVGDLVSLSGAILKANDDAILEDEVDVNELDGEDLLADMQVDDAVPDNAPPPTASASASAADTTQSEKKNDIHILTEEDIQKNTYTIMDVLLPLPGHSVILPANDIGQYIRDLLAKDDLSPEFFGKCNPSEHRMNGAYRHIMQMPKDFEWNFFEYSDPNEELVPTEGSYLRKMNLDKSRRRNDLTNTEIPVEYSLESKPYPITNLDCFTTNELPGKYGPGDGSEGQEEVIVDPKKTKTKLKGLQLKFTLPPGTYATMLLREITKHSTNAQYQTQLTVSASASASASASVTASIAAVGESSSSSNDSAVEVTSESPMKKSRISTDEVVVSL
jgi:tRNA pseudouridine13 synthase